MKKSIPFIGVAVGAAIAMTSCYGNKGGSAELKDSNDSLSYSIGVAMAEDFKQAKIEGLNLDLLLKGLKDHQDSTAVIELIDADAYIREQLSQRANKEAIESGTKFLEENKGKEGVQTTASGLQYKILSQGTGIKPDANDSITVHYEGKLIDGNIFDSSIKRGAPVTFPLNQVVAGWTEGFQLLSEGTKAMFYIPSSLGYGERDNGVIPPHSTLIFEVELIKVYKVD
ncbi:MAG: FKBP-type peptidyl-prolyl cis-trans isomerase [Flavobacteriales bacterium]